MTEAKTIECNTNTAADDGAVIAPRIEPNTKIKRPTMWTCTFLNDDFTPMKFVERVLMGVFHQSLVAAAAITQKIHTEGSANVGVYTFDVARDKADTTIGLARALEFPLQVVPSAL